MLNPDSPRSASSSSAARSTRSRARSPRGIRGRASRCPPESRRPDPASPAPVVDERSIETVSYTSRIETVPYRYRSRRSMEVKSVAYWIATILIAAETLAGGAADVAHGRSLVVTGTPVLDVVTSLGYPAYILTILGTWKLLG